MTEPRPTGPIRPAPASASSGGSTPARCRWKDCPEKATHYPGVLVWAVHRYKRHDPLRVVADLPLCRRHSRRTDWLTRSFQEHIAARMQASGLAAPDFKRARFVQVWIERGDHPYSRRPTE